MEEFRLTRSTSRPFGHEMTLYNFFLFEWLKTELISQWITEINELSHLVKQIQGTLRIEIISADFSNEVRRLKYVIDINGD
jgi:hypothetical protein